MITAHWALFGAALFMSLILTAVFRRLFLRWGIVDHPGERKIHRDPIPYGGGVAIYLTTVTIIGGCFFMAWSVNGWASSLVSPELQKLLPGMFKRSYSMLVIACGGLALVIMGLVDDYRGLSARLKFFLQFVIASAVVCLSPDVRATVFVLGDWLSIVITILWIVGITNAFNLLDNMDGLSAGCATIASFIFAALAMQAGQMFVSGLLLVFAGALLGFLWYNRPPARIFMGDAGSTFVGFFLAVLTVLSTYYQPGKSWLFPIAMPLLVLAVPLFDTFSVMFIRWKHKKPFFVGDNNHLSHRLVRLGMSKPIAVATILLITFCVGLTALLLPQLNLLGGMVALLQTVAIFAIITILEYSGKRNRDDNSTINGK